MAQIETWLKCDLKKPVNVQYLHGNLFSQDNQANLIGVELYDNGTAVTASGTVTANIIREDGATVTATGSTSGNKASVVLPAAAYAIPGAIAIIIKITLSGVITTVGAVVGTVYRSSTDTPVDPGTIMPSIQTLISQIQTAVASIPADYSSLWTSLAPAFSASTNYAAGQYVTNNGKVYRFNTAHTAGAWVASEVTEVKLGNEISDLNAALGDYILIERSSSGTLEYNIRTGKTYICKVLQGSNVRLSTRVTSGGTTVDTILGGSAAGVITLFTPTADTDYIRLQINDASKVILGEYNSIAALPYYTDSELGKIKTLVGNSTMGTTATTVTGAIAEHEEQLNDLEPDVSMIKSAFISNYYNKAVEAISSNTDINDILTPGNYRVSNGTVAETLSNLPENVAGRLTVCSINTADFILQIYLTNTGHLYFRIHRSSFTAWVDYTQTGSITNGYDNTKGYYSGEFCFYKNELYSRRNIGTAESSFTPARWDKVKLADILYELKAYLLKDENNLLFKTKQYRLNYYYNTSFQSSNDTVVFIVPVVANTTYYSNKKMRFVSKVGTKLAENVTEITPTETMDLYVTFLYDECDPFFYFSESNSFATMIPYCIFRKDMFSRLQRVIDERNLLNGASFVKRNCGYNGSGGGESPSTSYTYFIIPVTSGITYYIYSARMLSKANSVIVSQAVENYAYTANYTGNLYITFYNNKPWIVSSVQDMSDVAPYNCPAFTEKNVLQTTGSDTRRPMSQKAVTDALSAVQQEGNIYAALLSVLPGKNILQFGDSIMAGDGNQGTGIGELLAEKYGMTVYDYAVGGATMGYLANHSHIISQVNSAISAEREADIILISGGGNDMHGTTPNCPLGTVSSVYTEPEASDEFSNGFESVAYKVKNTWPEAMVIFVRVHNMASRAYDRQITYGERGIEIANKWGIGVLDMFKILNGNIAYYIEEYIPDRTHPNEAGYNRFYIPALEQYLYERRNEFDLEDSEST